MNIDQMDSIWIEDEPRESKLYMSNPSIQMINSETPILLSKKTIELPPLPPTSYFQHALDEIEYNKKRQEKPNKLMGMFKKLALNTDKSPTNEKKVRRKISTPYAFNHISHIDHTSPITNKSFDMPPPSLPPKPELLLSRQITNPSSKNSAVAFNRTSPQMDSTPARKIPRSVSNSTSLSSAAFTRSGSISTMATTISSTNKSRKQSSRLNSWQTSPKLPSSLHKQHQHTNSSSSIENLKKFEKAQITKQCSRDYNSSDLYNFPNENFQNWDTPDSTNVVRQSWIYNDDLLASPSPATKKSKSFGVPSPRNYLKRSNSFSHSPNLNDGNSIDLNLFQNEMESSFINKTESEYKRIMDSIEDFKTFFKNSIEGEKQELGSFTKRPNSTSLTRYASSSGNSLHSSSKLQRTSKGESQITQETEETQDSEDLDDTVIHHHKIFINDDFNKDDLLSTPNLGLSDAESTPRQHHVGTLLPSVI